MEGAHYLMNRMIGERTLPQIGRVLVWVESEKYSALHLRSIVVGLFLLN